MKFIRFGLPLLLAAFVGGAGCGGKDSPTDVASCTNVAGSYLASSSNSCGGTSTNQPVTVAQSGCNFSATIPGGNVTGTISGNSGTFSIAFAPPCGGTATGAATITSTAVVGTFAGSITTTGPGCCPLGAISGSFTLRK